MSTRTRIVLIGTVAVLGGCKPSAERRHQQLAAHSMATCRLVASGSITCWGNGGSGVLGSGKEDYFPGARLPAPMVGIGDVTQVSVGLSSSCALKRDGTVACAGIDWANATTGSSRSVNRASVIPGLTDVAEVSAGRSHVCVVHRSGEVSCWGDNGAAQAGQPFKSIVNVISVPTRVAGINDAVHVAAGEESTCVVHRDGGVSCWGRTEKPPIEHCDPGPGMIGCAKIPADGVLEGATKGKDKPRRIDGLANVKSVAVGNGFLCALLANGEVWCRGSNTLGELGGGDSDPHGTSLVHAKLPGPARKIALSTWNACALLGSGEVWCWGALPSTPSIKRLDRGPTRIANLPKAIDVAVGSLHGCAAVENNDVWCWGSGRSGETGHGHVENDHDPERVDL